MKPDKILKSVCAASSGITAAWSSFLLVSLISRGVPDKFKILVPMFGTIAAASWFSTYTLGKQVLKTKMLKPKA